jgi:hypothetical protein
MASEREPRCDWLHDGMLWMQQWWCDVRPSLREKLLVLLLRIREALSGRGANEQRGNRSQTQHWTPSISKAGLSNAIKAISPIDQQFAFR